MILVTGATDRVGFRLMEALADARAETTAMVRVDAEAADLPGAPLHVVADYEDPPRPEILRRFDRVFLLSPVHEEQAALEIVFIDALLAAGHRPHVVKAAPDGFQDPDNEVRFMVSHRQVAKHLDAVGLPVTYVASSIHMESLISAAETIREEGTIFAPAGQGRVAFVAASDVAAVAAKVLTTPGHEEATYVVTGAEALGYADVAAHISAVFARQVDYVDQSAEEARQMLLATGMGHWEADGMLEQFEWIRAGGADSVTGTVAEVTGTDPRPIEDWLADRRAAFLAPPLDLPPPTNRTGPG